MFSVINTNSISVFIVPTLYERYLAFYFVLNICVCYPKLLLIATFLFNSFFTETATPLFHRFFQHVAVFFSLCSQIELLGISNALPVENIHRPLFYCSHTSVFLPLKLTMFWLSTSYLNLIVLWFWYPGHFLLCSSHL